MFSSKVMEQQQLCYLQQNQPHYAGPKTEWVSGKKNLRDLFCIMF